MKLFDNHGALTLTKKKLLILLGVVLGVALITWGVLMVSIFHKGKKKDETIKVPDGYKGIYLLTKRTKLSAVDGSVSEVETYEYDEFGRIIRDRIEYADSGGFFEDIMAVYVVYTYMYDENGRLKQDIYERFEDGEIVSVNTMTTEYEYNSIGLVTKVTITDGLGYNVISEKTYSEDGLLLTYEINYNWEINNSIVKHFYQYDESGQRVKEEFYENDILETTVNYPEPGHRMTYQWKYDEESENPTFEWLIREEWLDEQGNVLIYKSYLEDGELYDWLEHEYADVSAKERACIKTVRKDKDGIGFYETNREFYVKPDNSVLTVKELSTYPDKKNSGEYGFYYTFDENGNPAMKINVNWNGTTYVSEKREYTCVAVPNEQ